MPPRKAAVRKPTAAEKHTGRTPASEVDVEEGPLVDLGVMAAVTDRGMSHLFTLDDVKYYIPKVPKANTTLRYLKMVRTEGEESAAAWMLSDLLGVEAYDALMNYDGLTLPMLKAVMAAVNKHVTGAIEGATSPLG